jgi:hypothetical protein
MGVIYLRESSVDYPKETSWKGKNALLSTSPFGALRVERSRERIAVPCKETFNPGKCIGYAFTPHLLTERERCLGGGSNIVERHEQSAEGNP